jgi:hypothetical protein
MFVVIAVTRKRRRLRDAGRVGLLVGDLAEEMAWERVRGM